MNRDGSHVRRITATKTYNRTPAWSPDGRLIAYGCKGDRNSEKDICISRFDGSRRRNITKDETLDRDPDWAPGGKRLVFSRQSRMPFHLFIMKRNGQDIRELSTTATDPRDPEWSPDGTRIVFTATGLLGGPDIYLVRPSGAEEVNLTMSPEFEGAASWSPDGTSIVFSRDDQLTLMSADGSDPTPIGVRGNNPKWAPDGQRVIAHRLYQSQHQRCFSIRLSGTNTKWLSPKGKQCYSPDWAPRR